MARHRNVRGYNYDEDFEDDDLYGQSVDDDYCISPSTAAQFIYSKRDNTSVSAEPLEEYDCEDSEHSNFISGHQLTRLEKAQLNSCLDHMKEVLGNTVPEKLLVEAVLSSNFDIQKALDSILAQDNKQNGKTKNEDNVIVGKPTKGLFCSEIFSNINHLTNLVENISDSTGFSFTFNGPVVNAESTYNTSVPNDKILFRSKCWKTPAKKKTITSSCKSLEIIPLSLSDGNEQSIKRDTLPQAESNSTTAGESCIEYDTCFNLGTELLKKNLSEKTSWSWSEFKDLKDLKDILRETGDSSDAQAGSLIMPQKNNNCGLKSCLNNYFDNLKLDNVNTTSNKMTESFESKNKCCFQGCNSNSSKVSNRAFSMSESPSLADLLQEHQGNNSSKPCSLHNLCNLPSADLTDMELEHSALSQLANHLPVSSGMTELSGSLSSLTHSKSSPVKELESLSLSDLIAKSIAVDSPEIINSHSEFHLAKKVQPSVVNSDIDLSVLIRKTVLSSEPEEIQLNTMLPETKALFSKQGQQMFLTKVSKKSKKKVRSPILKGTVSWAKALCAKPSTFAITLCLHYPSKRCKHQNVNIHKAFLYSRQIQEAKVNEIGPLMAITPFDFKSPSPDDIVKSGQKKAFTR
ncbi:HBS1-like protein isoform X2 [Notechis scutatus]|uniref:HBS1-like protein isoform X2 n=1 Tax=Notechis scutatus TaxID=8663 RepID=A0A6J1U253_9SAUR|nr:HBS1-like protein isoform X2 [Notechis scutatus]